MKAKTLNRKLFLNRDPCEGGAVRLLSNYRPPTKKCKTAHFNADLILQDCGRQISLDFWAGSKKELRSRLAKIRKLRQTIEELEGFMEEVYKEWPGDQ